MTHNEWIEKFTDYEAHFDQVIDEPRLYSALRAVVELHKPMDWHPGCPQCGYYEYPCPTIQAIEKELG